MSSSKDNSLWQEALRIFSRLSGWVFLPLLAGVFLGRWLDNRYSSSPRWFLIFTGLAFVISMIGLAIQAKREFAIFDVSSKDKDSSVKDSSVKDSDHKEK